MKIFVSWSKQTSREVALALQKMLRDFFKSKSLEVYLSSTKIEAGEDWFESVKNAISGSDICIIVLTDENELSRWIYFEAGAIAFNTKSTNIIPLLITTRNVDEKSPLNRYQYIKYSYEDIFSLFESIKKKGGLTGVRRDEFKEKFDRFYPQFLVRVKEILEGAVTRAVTHVPYGHIYPHGTRQVEGGKVFVGAPMASHKTSLGYAETKAGIADVVDAIEICCKTVRKTYWAGTDINSSNKFDGEETALLRDLTHLKSSSACVFVLFESLPTSVHVEIGYAIALNKPIIIFCKSRLDLPFLLRRADKQISDLKIYECHSYDDIMLHFERDGETMLRCAL